MKEWSVVRCALNAHEFIEYLIVHLEFDLLLLRKRGDEAKRNGVIKAVGLALPQKVLVLVHVDRSMHRDVALLPAASNLFRLSGSSMSRLSIAALMTTVSKKTAGRQRRAAVQRIQRRIH
jgi:hypothetical protein